MNEPTGAGQYPPTSNPQIPGSDGLSAPAASIQTPASVIQNGPSTQKITGVEVASGGNTSTLSVDTSTRPQVLSQLSSTEKIHNTSYLPFVGASIALVLIATFIVIRAKSKAKQVSDTE